ncbi:unnamed protein product, partial [Amoebophrya sp. A25]
VELTRFDGTGVRAGEPRIVLSTSQNGDHGGSGDGEGNFSAAGIAVAVILSILVTVAGGLRFWYKRRQGEQKQGLVDAREDGVAEEADMLEVEIIDHVGGREEKRPVSDLVRASGQQPRFSSAWYGRRRDLIPKGMCVFCGGRRRACITGLKSEKNAFTDATFSCCRECFPQWFPQYVGRIEQDPLATEADTFRPVANYELELKPMIGPADQGEPPGLASRVQTSTSELLQLENGHATGDDHGSLNSRPETASKLNTLAARPSVRPPPLLLGNYGDIGSSDEKKQGLTGTAAGDKHGSVDYDGHEQLDEWQEDDGAVDEWNEFGAAEEWNEDAEGHWNEQDGAQEWGEEAAQEWGQGDGQGWNEDGDGQGWNEDDGAGGEWNQEDDGQGWSEDDGAGGEWNEGRVQEGNEEGWDENAEWEENAEGEATSWDSELQVANCNGDATGGETGKETEVQHHIVEDQLETRTSKAASIELITSTQKQHGLLSIPEDSDQRGAAAEGNEVADEEAHDRVEKTKPKLTESGSIVEKVCAISANVQRVREPRSSSAIPEVADAFARSCVTIAASSSADVPDASSSIDIPAASSVGVPGSSFVNIALSSSAGPLAGNAASGASVPKADTSEPVDDGDFFSLLRLESVTRDVAAATASLQIGVFSDSQPPVTQRRPSALAPPQCHMPYLVPQEVPSSSSQQLHPRRDRERERSRARRERDRERSRRGDGDRELRERSRAASER